jgi:hypothetical protein
MAFFIAPRVMARFQCRYLREPGPPFGFARARQEFDGIASRGAGGPRPQPESAGHEPSLAHNPSDLGASDTTPLFLMTWAFYRRVTGEQGFLQEATEKALVWMDHRRCENRVIVHWQRVTTWGSGRRARGRAPSSALGKPDRGGIAARFGSRRASGCYRLIARWSAFPGRACRSW